MKTTTAVSAMRPRLAALAAAVLLAGCSMIPAYERPAAPVAPAWAGTPGTAAAQPAADIEWQSYFNDAQLRQLITLALQGNRDLRVAALNIEQARAQYQVRGADRFPTVNAAVTGSRTPNAAGGITSAYNAGFTVSAWEIDFFGRLASLKEAALAQYLATEEARKAVQISLVAAVATGYLNLLADEELLAITRQTLATREESLRLSKLRFDNGATSELDYRQAQSLAEAARVALAQQQRQRALDENALVLLLGQPLPAGFALTGNTAALTLPELPAGLQIGRAHV